MSAFDPILQGLLGGHANAGPLQGIIGSILGGGQAPQTGLLGGLFGGARQPEPQPQPQPSGGMGGLMGLIDQFRGHGMGHVADSWVGTGQNQPVSPQQLLQVFGQDRVNQWSQQSGMSQAGVLGALSQFLPQAIDRATPNGQVEQASDPFGGAGSSSASGGDPFEGAGINPGAGYGNSSGGGVSKKGWT